MKQLLLAAALLFSFSISARADWTKIESITTANLWGVCYGGNQYVAVGTAGTILTSPDGTKWTARASGTTEWLTAVAYGNNLYVAVGGNGTILTSLDGVTWTSRVNSGERLNGIAFGGGRFLTVGEAGTVRASTDTLTWSTCTLPVNTWLRGVCYGPDKFLIGAGDGTKASTEDGLVFRYVSKSSNSVEALFHAGGVTVAVGESSSIERATTHSTWSQIFGPPFFDTYSATLRGVARLGDTIVGVGAGGMMITMSYYGQPPDQLSRALLGSVNLNAVVNASAGAVIVGDYGTIYASPSDPLKVSRPNSSNITTSANRLFRKGEMQLTAEAQGTWLFTYQWYHDGRPIAGATTDSLSIKNAASTDAGTYSVQIGNAAGSAVATMPFLTVDSPASQMVDRGFRADWRPMLVSDWSNELVPLADGGLLVGFGEHGFGNHNRDWITRVNPDGTWGLSIRPVLRQESLRRRVVSLPDGSLLVYKDSIEKLKKDGSSDSTFNLIWPGNGFPVPLTNGNLIVVSLDGDLATLRRYHADGTLDGSYSITTVEVDPVHRTNPFDPFFTDGRSARDSQGRVIVAATAERNSLGLDQSRLFRLTPEGDLDTTLRPITVEATIRELQCVGTKIYYYAESLNDPLEQNHFSEFVRLNENASKDSSYQSRKRELSYRDSRKTKNVLLADGSALSVEGNLIKRYSPAGQLDISIPLSLGGAGEVNFINVQNDGRVLIAGSFESVDGWSTAGIAKLFFPSQSPATYLANLSIRTTAGKGDQTLIAGFVVAGEGGARSVLVRGIGPGLVPLGINARDAMTDPQLKLFRGQATLAMNNDWDASLEPAATRLGAYPIARDSKDAALFIPLEPGAYTAHLTSTSDASGIALIELYDADGPPTSASSPRVVNLAGRARVGTGDNVLIAGFVLSGKNAKRLLVRAVGPGLGAQGVTDFLVDPQLTIYRGADPIATNDDWNSSDQPVFKQVGAFDFTSASKDAAVVADLVPGVYTVVVRGANSTSGTALVEIYEIP